MPPARILGTATAQPQAQLHVTEAIDGEGVSPSPATVGAISAPPLLQQSKYFTLDGLMEPVEGGAIAAVKGSWLIAQYERGEVVWRRQDLPPEAFWTAAELRSLAEKLGDDYGCLFVALSYRWLSREHPDPQGFQLGIVAAVMRMYLGGGGNGTFVSNSPAAKSPLSWAFEKAGLHLTGEWGSNEEGASLGDCAVFWDFCSLFQQPRTEEQMPLFVAGLKASNVWYGHLRSVCWMQSELPREFEGAAYELSGWCFVEAAISAVIKPAGNRLDLKLRTDMAMKQMYGGGKLQDAGYGSAYRLTGIRSTKGGGVCVAKRLPPPLPEEVHRLLCNEKVFTNQSDVEKVADLYCSFFEAVAAEARELDLSGLRWGDGETAALVAVLPSFAAVKSLSIANNNDISGDGAQKLASAVLAHPSLESFSSIPLKELREGSLATLSLCNEEVGMTGAMVLAGLLCSADSSVIALDLRYNSLKDEGVSAICKAVQSNKATKLASLDVGYNQIGPTGAKALAAMAAATVSLTTINVQGNFGMGDADKAILRDALSTDTVFTRFFATFARCSMFASSTEASSTEDRCSFFFLPREAVLNATGRLLSYRQLCAVPRLSEATLELSRVVLGAYRHEYLAVSHRWETREEPDPDGIQLEAIQAYLRKKPDIKWVWYDYSCVPLGQHTSQESATFKRMLGAVSMLYLGCSVLLLVDSSYPSRFWTQFEAWLSMQTCTANGLATATEDVRRWTLVCVLGAKPQWEGAKIETMWRRAKADFVHKELSRRDVTVTNQSDKDTQLLKIQVLDSAVAGALVTKV